MGRNILFGTAIAIFIALAMACGRVSVPETNVTEARDSISIYPDYAGIVLPPNIAPMNFEIVTPGDEYVVRVSGEDGMEIIAGGKRVKWNEKKWHQLLEGSRGKKIDYEVYVRTGDSWKLHRFSNHVAEEDIDPYLSYRLIEPSYVQYSGMTLNLRDLTSFDERVIFNNAAPCDEKRGQCMNCHVPRNHYRDGASQFHVRHHNGGTVVIAGDSVVKVNLKTDSTLSAGVYPSWHPTLDLIAYSTNATNQKFFDFGERKVEVYDTASDLILYDMKTHEVSHIAHDSDLLETFPSWSPDGQTLYYSVARYPEGVTPDNLADHYAEIRYDIVSRSFDPVSRRFSKPDTVVYASARGESALLPRISPDGRFLLYCNAPFGTFHIWHKESDLRLKDLATGEDRPLTEANSADTESYHTWASSGRWIVFSSRRDDGSYTRPYIAHIDVRGRDSKAFVVPQEDPAYYRELMKSYNVPEFLLSPVEARRPDLLRAVNASAKEARFRK